MTAVSNAADRVACLLLTEMIDGPFTLNDRCDSSVMEIANRSGFYDALSLLVRHIGQLDCLT